MDVLTHPRESLRPTSTGHLITRVMPYARGHYFRHEEPPLREDLLEAGREFWILHPSGDAPPSGVNPSSLQVLLLDGSWREAARMRRTVGAWGRLVALPPAGPSRYHLRAQHAAGNYSTVEALILLLTLIGEHRPATELRTQFELHVYAGLRTRGDLVAAEAFLSASTLEETLPEPLRALCERRPRS